MSDKKEKDSKVKSSKAKKNVEKTQEVSVSAEKKIFPHSCTDCGVLNCSKRNASYPEFCLTEKLTEKELEKVVKLYTENEENNKIAIASAEVEGGFYGKYTRVEEIMEVAKRIGAKKIGIATCVGLIEESRIFASQLYTFMMACMGKLMPHCAFSNIRRMLSNWFLFMKFLKNRSDEN